MDQISVAAASGILSRMEALDMLSNNLANSGTAGYKVDREFYSLFRDQTGADGITLPVIQKQWTDFQQGTLTPTGNPLDLALAGKGFFAVNGPTGPLYTRNGSFQISPKGILTTMDGYTVRAVGGQTIQTVSQAPLQIAPDGTVRQDGQALGQVQLADFNDVNALVKIGNSYYRPPNPKAQPAAPANATIEQGKLESSNVAPAESSVRLVELMRQYEMLQKAVTVAADMDKKAINDVARVAG
jgi:flagellar basal-body rod protein FlgF